MTKIIAISNHKGGVGKTTSTINIGAGLSQGGKGKKVLLIDLDPQANLTQGFGIEDPITTIYEILKGQQEILPIKLNNKLDLIPASVDLAVLEMELVSFENSQFILKDAIEVLKDKYDFILIDCPPSLGFLTVNALTASDEVYIPLQTEYFSIRGLTRLLELMDKIREKLNKNLALGGVILTQYHSRRALTRHIDPQIEELFKEKVFKTKIRHTVSIPESQTKEMDIFSYNSNSIGAKDYISLCKEILKRL